jgi:arylsulfatase A-like enzyme
MERRDFIQITGSIALTGLPGSSTQSFAGPGNKKNRSTPNIVVIMTDQQRADFTKSQGFSCDTQPFLDTMAQKGVRFSNAYTTSALCAPARTSLLTGRYPQAHRVRENPGANDAYFAHDIVDVLKQAGYRTGLSGKPHCYLKPPKLDFWREYWHSNGFQEKDAPQFVKDFDNWINRLNHGISETATPYPVEAQFPYRIVNNAIEFVQQSEGKPFFLWLSFPEPHNPYQVPEPYFDLFPPDSFPERVAGPESLSEKPFKWKWLRQLEEHFHPGYDKLWRRLRSNYCGMLRLIDDQLKRFNTYLKQQGLEENTLFIYVSDHGDFVGDYGLLRKGVGLPEVLTRVPMIWKGPGIKNTVFTQEFVSIADIMPTLCEAVGAEIPVGVQGRSLWPMLQGKEYPKAEFDSIYAENGIGGLFYDANDNLDFNHASIRGPENVTFDELNSYTQSGRTRMVRKGDWKLVFDMMVQGQLYNLKDDPAELHDLFQDPALIDIRESLFRELARWSIRLEDPLPIAQYQHKWPKRNWY